MDQIPFEIALALASWFVGVIIGIAIGVTIKH